MMKGNIVAVLTLILLASLGFRSLAFRQPALPRQVASPSTNADRNMIAGVRNAATPHSTGKPDHRYVYSVRGVHMGDGQEQVISAFGDWSRFEPQARRDPSLTRLVYPGLTIVIEGRMGWGVIEIRSTSESVDVADKGKLRLGFSALQVTNILGKPSTSYTLKDENRESYHYYSELEHLTLRLHAGRLEEIIVSMINRSRNKPRNPAQSDSRASAAEAIRSKH